MKQKTYIKINLIPVQTRNPSLHIYKGQKKKESNHYLINRTPHKDRIRIEAITFSLSNLER
jgi:hypothetical protein